MLQPRRSAVFNAHRPGAVLADIDSLCRAGCGVIAGQLAQDSHAVRHCLTAAGIAALDTAQRNAGLGDLNCEQALNAARANLLDAYRRAWELVLETGEAAPPEVEIELRTAAVFATDVALDVTRRMFRHAGGHALYSGNVIERCMRDMQAASQHMAMNQISYELRGQALLGFQGLRAAD
jgi:alkylation response protein AidB-like acyl-CoA dehydrogenase